MTALFVLTLIAGFALGFGGGFLFGAAWCAHFYALKQGAKDCDQ